MTQDGIPQRGTADVVLWAQRILAKKTERPHLLLEIRETASVEDAQNAFHKIARRAHPDLHRNALSPDELELVTSAYSTVAGAYQAFRSQLNGPAAVRRTSELPVAPTPSGTAPLTGPATQMSSRALVHYRKAELSLRRGELNAAVLHLKMAIATDPGSPFLRTALAEVETELARG